MSPLPAAEIAEETTLGQCFRESRLDPATSYSYDFSYYAKYTVTLFSWEDFRRDLHAVQWIWGRLFFMMRLSRQTLHQAIIWFWFWLLGTPCIMFLSTGFHAWGKVHDEIDSVLLSFYATTIFSSAFPRKGHRLKALCSRKYLLFCKAKRRRGHAVFTIESHTSPFSLSCLYVE